MLHLLNSTKSSSWHTSAPAEFESEEDKERLEMLNRWEKKAFSKLALSLSLLASTPLLDKVGTEQVVLCLTVGLRCSKMGRMSVLCFWLSLGFWFGSSHNLVVQALSIRDWCKYCSWVVDYLTFRQQRAVINGSTSDCVAVLSGVPPGSVLGPLLFLIYVNDLVSLSECRWTSTQSDYCVLRNDVAATESCSFTNSFNFNISKCKYMIISRKMNANN